VVESGRHAILRG